MAHYDFAGYATKNNLRCSDGRTILKDAFKECDGQTVPLVWGHQHNDPEYVLGHALLENREDGVYAYGSFNDSPKAKVAKQAVQHGDITAMSIFANKLKQKGGDVLHGVIREVSLVLAGANKGATIEYPIIQHADGTYDEAYDEAIIHTGLDFELAHADEDDSEGESNKEEKGEKKVATENKEGGKTIKQILDTLSEEQMDAVTAYVAYAVENADEIKRKAGVGGDDDDDEVEHSYYEEGDEYMKHNVFDSDYEDQGSTLSHDEMATIINDAKRYGSLKDSFLAHAQEYGIENIDYLFPEARSLNTPPDFIQREMGWVQKVMSGVHHTPFSRIKSVFANITEDEARARGYIKGKLKKEEVFPLLKRTTTPTTIYKKQKLDRDDIIDITDFDVVAWLKSEMRLMLDEEIARAILIGDGRGAADEDKISELNIRPIATDADLYTIKKTVVPAEGETLPKAFIKAAIKARKDYKGTGTPTLFCTEDLLADMLLLEDGIGHLMYTSESQLATTLRVSSIVTVPVMENQGNMLGIIVNLADYNVGADKGGAVSMFDDFDIDYNQQKYLIETRCSGALTKPYSAIVLSSNE